MNSGETLPEKLPGLFTVLELPGYYLPKLFSHDVRLPRKNILQLYLRDLLSPSVTREVVMQTGPIRREFKNHFRKLIAESGQAGACGVSADFDFERTFRDSDYLDSLHTLLRSFYGTLHEAELDLVLPVRVPLVPEVETTESYLGTARKFMSNNLSFSLDIHPHELAGKEIDPESVLRWLRFDLSALRFVYEPETGNKLVPKLVEPWLDAVKKLMLSAQIVFVPVVHRRESLENELILLEELISGLNN
jgi:hypothetical protein